MALRLLKYHKAAFFARDSPGPAGVGEEFGPKFEGTKPRMAMAMPFAHKTKLVWPGAAVPRCGGARRKTCDIL